MTAHARASKKGDGFRVSCDERGCPRPLDMRIETREHAANLAAKHNREHHPDTPATLPVREPSLLPDGVNLTAAAHCLIERWEHSAGDPYATTGYVAMERLWWDLTGTEDTDSALTLAHAIIAESADVHAYLPPL